MIKKKMYRWTYSMLICSLLCLLGTTTIVQCAPKYGCPAEQALKKDSKRKKGIFGPKKPKDGLFDQSTMKKSRKK